MISGTRKTTRISACVSAFIMLAFILLSVVFIAIEADHECIGEDCPVCAGIRQCKNALQRLGDGAIFQAEVSASVVVALFAAELFVTAVSCKTPVSEKVRLND